jgi:hypothetical protein
MLAVIGIVAQLSSGFTGAAVEGTEIGDDMVRITVTVRAAPGGSVVVHLVDPGGEQITVAMAEQSSGLYRAVTEIAPIDYVAVFEGIANPPFQSEPQRLTELGLDRALITPDQVFPAAPATTVPEDDPARWGWLGLGLGAASLSLLAFWVLGAKSEKTGRHASSKPEASSPKPEA